MESFFLSETLKYLYLVKPDDKKMLVLINHVNLGLTGLDVRHRKLLEQSR